MMLDNQTPPPSTFPAGNSISCATCILDNRTSVGLLPRRKHGGPRRNGRILKEAIDIIFIRLKASLLTRRSLDHPWCLTRQGAFSDTYIALSLLSARCRVQDWRSGCQISRLLGPCTSLHVTCRKLQNCRPVDRSCRFPPNTACWEFSVYWKAELCRAGREEDNILRRPAAGTTVVAVTLHADRLVFKAGYVMDSLCSRPVANLDNDSNSAYSIPVCDLIRTVSMTATLAVSW